MRVHVASARGAPIVAIADLATAAGNTAWGGLGLWQVPGEAYAGYPLPEDAEPVERPVPGASAAELYAYAKARRQTIVESRTISVGPYRVGTDETTRANLAAAMLKVTRTNNAYQISDWRVGDNQYLTLTSDQITTIADAVEAEFQRWFTVNKGIDASIADGSVTTYEQVDTRLAGAAA